MSVKYAVALLGAALVGAAPAPAQTTPWVGPRCDLKPGHTLVNRAQQYLKNAATTQHADQRQRDLTDASRMLTQALTTGEQGQNPAAWYYLARYHVLLDDPVGADSAFTKAEELSVACRGDIAIWRHSLWVPSYNGGVQAWQAGNTDSAIAGFSRAAAIFKDDANTFIYLATLYANAEQPDSSVKYFQIGAKVAAESADTAAPRQKREALFNVARVYHRASRWDDAGAAYREYLKSYPNDAQAVVGLALIHSAQNRPDSAVALYSRVIDRADSVDAIELFEAGAAIYNSVSQAPDTGDTGTACRSQRRRQNPRITAQALTAQCDSVSKANKAKMQEYSSTSRQTYRMAERAFKAGLEKNPFYRDGWFNLSHTYFALRDTANMLPAAQQLVALDPMNRNGLRLLAQGWNFRGKGDSAYYYLVLADSLLPVEVNVTRFNPEDDTASLKGMITDYHPKKKSEPWSMVVEFLDAKGQVVVTQTVPVPALDPEGNHPFEVQAAGKGITAWRYRKG
ncbi:MAG: tetratricopeptide repeat protein [Gemmatimonadales bacterium]